MKIYFWNQIKPDNAVRFDRQTPSRTPTSPVKEFDGQFDKMAEDQAIQMREIFSRHLLESHCERSHEMSP